MRRNRVISAILVAAIINLSLSACGPSNVRVQTSDKIYFSNKSTKLTAGFGEIEDKRPDSEKENDWRYEVPVKTTISQKIFRDLKLSGVFADVRYGDYDAQEVDVIIRPSVDSYYYQSGPNGWTPLMFLLAITGLPGLIYIVAGGPSGDHNAEARLGLKLTDSDGHVLATGSGSKKLTSLANIHNSTSEGIGAIDGRALSEASYDAITALALNIKQSKLPKPKSRGSSPCDSGSNCKEISD